MTVLGILHGTTWRDFMVGLAFTKPPLLQENMLTGGGSPNLEVHIEWKVPVDSAGTANQNCKTGLIFCYGPLLLLLLPGFLTLYEDTGGRRAATNKF